MSPSPNTPEYQRLRRVKQLGFSEFVYPGATHSRFSHSIGVFETARVLCQIIDRCSGLDDTKELKSIALIAALVHDLGHGPFSHSFEGAMKALNKKKSHEDWTAEIIMGDTVVGAEIEKNFGPEIQKKISSVLTNETPENIFEAVVSSQFDADRLDYIRRDRMMTGANYGNFDVSWILANLEVGEIQLTVDREEFRTVDTLVLGPKSLQAAEAYVLGLFQLYFCVYFHKTTRSAEVMLSAILTRLGQLIESGEGEKSGLSNSHPLMRFLTDNDLETYLRLDDFVIWGALNVMRDSPDPVINELANRLLDRRLYKVVDVASRFRDDEREVRIAKFRSRLAQTFENDELSTFDAIQDSPSRTPYKRRKYGSTGGLDMIYIKRNSSAIPTDLSQISDVVKALEAQSLMRVHVRDEKTEDKINNMIAEG